MSLPQPTLALIVLVGTGALLEGAALHDVALRTTSNAISIGLGLVGQVLRLQNGEVLTSLLATTAVFALAALWWRRGWNGALNSNATARTATIEVTHEQAEHVGVAGRMGRILLSVRAASGPGDTGLVRPVTWAKDISSALGGSPAGSVSVFASPADKKEFKF